MDQAITQIKNLIKKHITPLILIFPTLLFVFLHGVGYTEELASNTLIDEKVDTILSTFPSPLTLEHCISIALEKNHKRRISGLAVEIAQSQHQQVLSSFWPQISAEVGYNRLDEDVNFIFPKETSTFSISGLAPVPLTTQVSIPEKDITVMDKESVLSRLQLSLPLFTGGMRSSLAKAAKSNINASKHSLQRTELELIYDVQRIYYGVVLAKRMADIGTETLTRLETTNELTEKLYMEGSGSVTKLDYLRSKVITESARSVIETLDSNVILAKSALANTMGLSWKTPFLLKETEIPFLPVEVDLNDLVAGTYRFNPDWKRMAAGLEAGLANVDVEKAGHWPKLALTGTLWRWDNELDSGIASDENSDGWTIGLGLQMPIFSGFRTTQRINEAKAKLRRMQSQQVLLKEGLALQVKNSFIRMQRSGKIQKSAQQAANDAREYRELASRAYINELIGTEEVIEAQIIEAMARAKSEMANYDHAAARYNIDFVVGREIENIFQKQ